MSTAPSGSPDPWALMPGPSVVVFGFDVLDRVEQAAAMVKERLERSVAAFDAAGIPHAVVGGHAVAAWVARIDPAAVRTTVDVDLRIDRADRPRAIVALEQVGFIHHERSGSTPSSLARAARPARRCRSSLPANR